MSPAFRTAVVSALSVALVTGAVATGGASTGTAPTVKLVRLAPVEVAGAGFGNGSLVRVTVRWQANRLAKTVRATPAGAIKATFGASLTAFACRATLISAVGGNGRQATWRPGSKSCYAIAVPIAPTG
jgi:hypothetical protein